MIEPITRACVVDASVGVKLFLDESLSDEAHELFAHLADDPPAGLHVPDLFYIECANILWKHHQRLGLPAGQAREFMSQLGLLALQSTPTAELVSEALDIAIDYQITAYDAAYIALAQRLSAPLVTADHKLVRALAASPVPVRWLGDAPRPPDPW